MMQTKQTGLSWWAPWQNDISKRQNNSAQQITLIRKRYSGATNVRYNIFNQMFNVFINKWDSSKYAD